MAESGNVIIRLIADIREFMAKMNEGEAKVGEFAKSSEAMGVRFQKAMGRAQTAVIATGVAIGAYGVKSAYDYVEALDKLRTQAGASAGELEYVKQKALDVSNATGQSSHDIVDAYVQVEKAGIRNKRATELVTNAAKAANITGAKTADIAKQIVAAQTLQIAKGMDTATISDLIVKANQAHIGSLGSLFSVLSGKVGGALAAYGVTMAQAATISNVAAKAGYTNARTLSTLATSMAKVENPTKSYAKSLATVGINSNKLAADAKRPGGIVNVLKDIQQAAHDTGQSVSTIASTVFGASGGALATILTNNLPTVMKQVTSLGGASGKGLETAFGISQEQLGKKVAMLKTQLQNALTGVGLLLLPAVTDVANWVTNVVKEFHKHPLFGRLATDAAIGLFAGAVIGKITTGIKNMVNLFRGSIDTGLLRIIATNTGLMARENAGGGIIPAGALGLAEGAGLSVGGAVALGGAMAFGLYYAASSGKQIYSKDTGLNAARVGAGARGPVPAWVAQQWLQPKHGGGTVKVKVTK